MRLLRGPDSAAAPDVAIDVAAGDGGTTVISVRGELDLSSVPRLRSCLADLVTRGDVRLIVDLSGVAFCDSTALGVFVGAHRRATAAGGHVRFVHPPPALRNLLEVSGLDQILDVS